MSNDYLEYGQDGGPLSSLEPGKRVREALGGDGGLGSRLGGSGGPDVGQGMGSSLEVPDNPGPSVAGRTPLVGTVRRSNGMPVLRDQLGDGMGS